ncbi:MAG: DegQ family serine endoprotease [Nitratireductor sp.]
MSTQSILKSGRVSALAGAGLVALVIALSSQYGMSNAALAGEAIQPAISTQSISWTSVVKADKPAVVTIITTAKAEPAVASREFQQGTPFDEFFQQFFNERGMPGQMPGQRGMPAPRQRSGGLGSGFIISADGAIVTNNHVVDGADEIKVVLDNGTELPGKLVGRDAKTDLAVIRVKAETPLAHIDWGQSDKAAAGDPVLAIGNPFGIGTTVTSGIVSARGRDLHNGPYDDFIQVDAAINHGNSGGPLLNANGEVIGVNSAIYSPNGGNVGVGFAIPSDQAREIVARLIEHGSIEHGFIGIQIQPVTKDVSEAIGLAKDEGALVADVTAGSPAEKAGLKPGDVVTAFGGKDIKDPKALSRTVADLAPGTASQITVWRNGKEKNIDITVGNPDANKVASNDSENQAAPSSDETAVPDLGITLSDLTPDQRQQMDFPEETHGAVITAVTGDKANEQGLKEGDIILSVNQSAIDGASDAARQIAMARKAGRNSVLLLVEHGDAQAFVALPFAQG